MDSQHLILNHWEEEQKTFDTHLVALQKHIDAEGIHQLRVAIKKLRAYLKLLILLKNEPGWNYLLNRTKDLFDALGKERDVEICLALLPLYEKEKGCRYRELKQYLEFLQNKMHGWSNQSIHRYQDKELTRVALLLKEDNCPGSDELVRQIQQIIHTHLEEIKEFLKKPHKLRRKLKQLYCWISILPGDMPVELYDANALHHILDELGNWQDHETLLRRAKHFRKDYLPKQFEETSVLLSLEDNLQAKKELLRKSAIDKTKRWLKRNLVEEAES